MNQGFFHLDKPVNEPVKVYTANSDNWKEMQEELEYQASHPIEIPCVIGGKKIYTGDILDAVEPHRHQNVLAHTHLAGAKELREAIEAAMAAKAEWEALSWEHRVSIFLKAADLLTGPYRKKMTAACMLKQSKNVYEAEIDAICELADFLRFNAYYLEEIYAEQPLNTHGIWNRNEYRPLEGFVAALAPFNFTSISGNLCAAPAMAGNVTVWKPSTTAVLSSYYLMEIFEEAGLPAGVINFVPSRGSDFGQVVVADPRMAGFHFTGSTEVFNSIWKQVGEHIDRYESYPRLVGETGGKDFIFAHASANADALVSGLIRGAFAFAGQKCSAASRAYIPASLWPQVREKMHQAMTQVKTGDVRDIHAFLNAVIDEKSFGKIKEYVEYAKNSPDCEVIEGGSLDDSVGYFVEPTVILAKKPDFRTMVEEIFGPVLTIYVYEDAKLSETLALCDQGTGYALSGAVYANDRTAIAQMERALAHAAGNFYINDKPTGAVVGQQPFGGARRSGTNDKAGSRVNMMRWLSQRTIKENWIPDTEVLYPHMK
ncbi:L-glutamate gamma-semialdehyde dehydrogenase [Hominifimenecus sp. rT4P-3]|uniref:L-glutamate gamma-semialdehyde dehydrogenase n=1 Tax=Hominifimenecus sp. rT4P-3 TaxID=3242979 RepID=UPI003DA43079